MQNCEKSILNAIYKYINEDLDKLIEDTIFSVNSKAALGEAYYGYIISSINGSDRDSINKVVSVLGLKDSYQTQEEFYKELVEIIGYKKMSYEILATVRVKFDDIFTIKRNAVNGKYQAEIRRINEALWENKTNSDSIKNKAAAKSFVHDISADEESLYELSSECNALRTRKEMMEYVMHFVESSLREVCNFDDLSDVEKTVRLRFPIFISHRLRRNVDWMLVRILICLNLRMQNSQSVHRRRKRRLCRRLNILVLYSCG